METMSDYTLYCTEEQTRRAYKLGAPIINIAKCGVSSDYPFIEIDGVDFYIPTTYQIMGWLRELYIEIILHPWIESVFTEYEKLKYTCEVFTGKYGNLYVGDGEYNIINYETYKQAELAAIDAALDFLEKGE